MNDVPHENEEVATDATKPSLRPRRTETSPHMVADIDDVEVDVVHRGEWCDRLIARPIPKRMASTFRTTWMPELPDRVTSVTYQLGI